MKILACKIKVPAKVVLLGEWAVLKKGPCISTALNSYFVLKAHYREQQNYSEILSEKFYSRSDKASECPAFLMKSWEILDFLRQKWTLSPDLLKGYHIHLDRQWPLEYGWGSSSALFLALAAFCAQLSNKALQPLELQKMLIEFQGGGSGIDLLTQFYGASILYKDQKIDKIHLKFPPHLRLVHSFEKAITSQELKKHCLNANPAIEGLAQSTQKFLSKKNWKESIEEHHKNLLLMKLVPEDIQQAFQQWKNEKKVHCYKTTGAGGGDTLLTLINPEKEAQWLEDVKKRSWVCSGTCSAGQGLTIEVL